MRKEVFGDLYDIPSRNGVSRPSRVRGSGFKMINMGELFANDRIYDIEMELVPLNEKEQNNFKVKPFDLLFARQSIVAEGAGKCSIIMEVGSKTTCFESHIIRVRLNEDKAYPLFYYYFFQSQLGKGYLSSIRQQGVQAGIRGSELALLKLPYFSVPTQRKIASILSSYDDLIENNLKRIKLLEEKAQLTYEEWFVRLKFPGHENTPMNEETGLPEGWEKRPFEDVIDFKEGPGLRNWQYREEGIPFLNIRVIKDGDVDMTKVQFLDPKEVENKYKHFLLEENDHVISSSGTLGRLTTIRKCHLPICLNTSIIRMRSKDEQFGKWLIKHTLLGQIFQSTMEIYANGSAQVNFGPTHLKQIKLPIPSAEIALKYERIMEPIEEHIKLLRDKNQYLKEARDILLPRLMTGMIDVDELEIKELVNA